MTARSLSKRWLALWFEPAAPTNLAICRILFFGAFSMYYFRLDLRYLADAPDVLWAPIWLFHKLDLPVLPVGVLGWIQRLWKISLATSCVGLLTHFSTALAFMLGFYLLGLPQNFGKTNHNNALIVLLFAVLALSRCGDALSLDRLLRRRDYVHGPVSEIPPSGEYTWPVRCAWLLFALIFFAAGYAKLRNGGIAWISSDNLALLLLRGQREYDPLIGWGAYIAKYGWLCHVLATAVVALELSYPLALVSRRARALLVPSVFLLQVNIALLLGPRFYEFLICHLFWVPWDTISGSVTSLWRGRFRQR
jgi:hypothetical protein